MPFPANPLTTSTTAPNAMAVASFSAAIHAKMPSTSTASYPQ